MTTNTPHERRVGDLVTAYTGQLMRMDDSTPPASVANDLTGKTVTFTMYNAATGVIKVNAQAATVVTAASGLVKYDFAAADVDTAGIFWGSFVVTESAELDTYPAKPSDGLIWIHSATQTAQEAYQAAAAINGVLQLKRGHTETLTFTSDTADVVSDLSVPDTKVFLGIKDAAGRTWLSIEGSVLVATGLQSVRFVLTSALALTLLKGKHFYDVVAVYGYSSSLTPPYTSLQPFKSGRANITDIYLDPLEL